MVPSCWFVGEKPGCCCLLYVLSFESCFRGVSGPWERRCFGLGAIQSIDSLIIWRVDYYFLITNETKHKTKHENGDVMLNTNTQQVWMFGFHSSRT